MRVKQNQTTLDLATQKSGDVAAVLDLCLANGLSITDALAPNSELKDYETNFKNDLVLNFFAAKNKELATGGTKAEAIPLGVGTMIIQTNFDII